MAQFDVYPHPVEAWREVMPFVVDVQSSWVAASEVRLTVPLLRRAVAESRLTPHIHVNGSAFTADVLSIAAYPASELRGRVANVQGQSSELWDALDFVFHGY